MEKIYINCLKLQFFIEISRASVSNLSVKTLQFRRAAHKAPAFLKIGRSVRYRLVDLDAFLSAHRVDPEARA